jgi:hypothetical protein
MYGHRGRDAPRVKASAKLTEPATKPFTEATQVASARETLRVRLLSMPHAKHAPRPPGLATSLQNARRPPTQDEGTKHNCDHSKGKTTVKNSL